MPDWLRGWVKPAVVGTVLGTVFAVALAALPGVAGVDLLMKLIVKRAFGDLKDLGSDLQGGGAPAWLLDVLAFALGRGLPATAGAALTVCAVPLLRLPVAGRPLVEHGWPGASHILDRRLERPGVDPTDPYAPGWPVLGREAEMAALMRFAGPASGDEPAVLALTGVEGMGKTRLALAWLSRLKALGWEVGVLKAGVRVLDIEVARFRRRTAVVVDEPSSGVPDLHALLDALTAQGGSLRILVVDRFVMPRPAGPRQGEALPELRLAPLPDAVMRRLAPDLAPKALAAAEGRPLYALLGDDPGRTISDRANRRLVEADTLGEGQAQRLLALAALAGPYLHGGTRVKVSLLRRLFEGAPRDMVLRLTPALKPARFADAVLLHYAEECTEGDLHELLAEALDLNPAAVEARLGSLWSAPGVTDAQGEARAAMQARFDAATPDRVEAARATTARCADETAHEPQPGRNGTPDLNPLAEALERVRLLAGMRPFDPAIRLEEARAAVNAVNRYGEAGRWDDLERWGARLAGIAAVDAFRDDPNLGLMEATAAFNAITAYADAGRGVDLERWGRHLRDIAALKPSRGNADVRLREAMATVNVSRFYGIAGRWDDLERWARYLADITALRPFRENVEIRRMEAQAVVNAVKAYCEAERWDDVERWARYLADVATLRPFQETQDIRLEEAKAAVLAVYFYGAAKRWDDLERWVRYLVDIATLRPFREDQEIRLEEAKAALNAANAYGIAGRWDDLERWSRHLQSITALESFRANPQFRHTEAKAALNAVCHYYGAAGRLDDLERWSQHLHDIATLEPFRADLEIRLEEAKGAVNAISGYGAAARWDDLERWGRYLHDIVALEPFRVDLEIRLEEAKAAVNAIYAYGEAGRWDDLERWGRRIIDIAALEPLRKNPEIRLAEAKAGSNALIDYGKAGLHGTPMTAHWRSRLAAASRDFPYHPGIQELANRFGLGAVAQSVRPTSRSAGRGS